MKTIQTRDQRLETSDQTTRVGLMSHVSCLMSGGFTLVEMLVVIVIFGGIMGALMISFLISKSSYLSADAYIQVQQEARRGLDAVVKEFREADPNALQVFDGSGTVVGTNVPGVRVDFPIALGYNIQGSVPCCPVGTCWGAKDQAGTSQCNWKVRYRVAGTGGTQLLREVVNGGGAVVNTRVLANDVNSAVTTFNWSGTATKTLTIKLEVRELSAQLAGGSMTTTAPAGTPLTATVRLRN